jgi:hypothetical protein
MIRNGLVVYDSEGQIVCSAIVPSSFRRTLTGVQPPAFLPAARRDLKSRQTLLIVFAVLPLLALLRYAW